MTTEEHIAELERRFVELRVELAATEMEMRLYRMQLKGEVAALALTQLHPTETFEGR